MNDPSLQKVIEELKARGLRAGEDEAARIREAAEADAARIRAEAKAEAERMVAQAQRDREAQKKQLDAELRQAAAVGLVAFRQALEQALVVPELDAALSQALAEPAFLQELLMAAATAFAASGGADNELELILSAEQQDKLAQGFVGRVTERLGGRVQVRFDQGVTGGFQLAPGGSGYVLDFTEHGFQEIFLSFLAPRFRSYYFEQE
jgi:V/A-type H+-transporting ATPase subunit E